jgi:hypothetical protein
LPDGPCVWMPLPPGASTWAQLAMP